MGKWRIQIDGHGIHHNKRPDDAEQMAGRFVQELRNAGHDVESATISLVQGEDADGTKTFRAPEDLQ